VAEVEDRAAKRTQQEEEEEEHVYSTLEETKEEKEKRSYNGSSGKRYQQRKNRVPPVINYQQRKGSSSSGNSNDRKALRRSMTIGEEIAEPNMKSSPTSGLSKSMNSIEMLGGGGLEDPTPSTETLTITLNMAKPGSSISELRVPQPGTTSRPTPTKSGTEGSATNTFKFSIKGNSERKMSEPTVVKSLRLSIKSDRPTASRVPTRHHHWVDSAGGGGGGGGSTTMSSVTSVPAHSNSSSSRTASSLSSGGRRSPPATRPQQHRPVPGTRKASSQSATPNFAATTNGIAQQKRDWRKSDASITTDLHDLTKSSRKVPSSLTLFIERERYVINL
jgi:hypothetical protein